MQKSLLNSKDRSARRFGASTLGVGVARAVLLAVIATYRVVLRPAIGPACRFAPSCSVYAEQAIHRHGPLYGAWLAMRRIGRCHPWNPGGYDPVPQRGH